MNFQNKTVVIAGGTSGIGLATARQFQQQGGVVTVTGRNKAKLQRAGQAGLKAVALDSVDRQAVERFFSAHGPVDHLVLSLGGNKGIGAFSELSLAELREAFDAKFWPQLETLQSALPYLRAGGSVTLVTAISATGKMPGTAGLAAINGGLEIMVPILSRELTAIRINAVSPGVVDTPWWDFIPPADRKAAFGQFTAGIPAAREAQPEEIAEAIVFLAGNEYIRGKILAVDGGMA